MSGNDAPPYSPYITILQCTPKLFRFTGWVSRVLGASHFGKQHSSVPKLSQAWG